MKILIVEDDEFKRQAVGRAVSSQFPKVELIYARSIVSSLGQIEANPELTAVILDMSLPTYDVSPKESGGRPQGFGGLTVLQHLEALDRITPVIVLTQFQQFGEDETALDFDGLNKMLIDDHSDVFRGIVKYGAGSDRWKEDLERILAVTVGEV